MSTFSNVGASTSNLVGGNQYNIINTISDVSITEALEKFAIVSAAYNSYERYSERASACSGGTRDAVLWAIIQWTQINDRHRMCLLSGRAGTGKSTIAHTIAKLCDQEQRLGFSFFFSRRNRDRSDITLFIPTLAYQLSVFLPGVQDPMERAVARNPAIFHQSPKDQLTQLVIDPLLSIVDSLSTMTIVIDGLDEYSGEVPLAELVALFHDMSNRLPFRIFFTSRPEPRVQKIFNSPSVARPTYHLKLQDFSSQDEVHALLHSRLLTVRDEQGLPSNWPSRADVDQLSELCDGLYIYAEMLIRFIDDDYGFPPERLQSALNTSCHIDHLYDQILREGRRYPAFEQVIGSIVYSAYPLSIAALAELLQLSSDKIRFALQECLSILVVPDDDEDCIRLYHPSLRDFFTDRERAKDHFLDPLQFNLSIMDHCVKLLHSCFADDGEGRVSVRYACRYWCHHLRMVVSCTSGVDHVTSDVKARMIELMKNLQSPWLKNWMAILENVPNVKEVRKDLSVVVTQFEVCRPHPSDGKSSAVFRELHELLATVDKFLEVCGQCKVAGERTNLGSTTQAPQWAGAGILVIDDRTNEHSDSDQSPEIPFPTLYITRSPVDTFATIP